MVLLLGVFAAGQAFHVFRCGGSKLDTLAVAASCRMP